jgi:hypothetical protein
VSARESCRRRYLSVEDQSSMLGNEILRYSRRECSRNWDQDGLLFSFVRFGTWVFFVIRFIGIQKVLIQNAMHEKIQLGTVLGLKFVCSISAVSSTMFVRTADCTSMVALRETRYF